MAQRREDLEQMEFRYPRAIGDRCMPPMLVNMKVGDYGYADVNADTTAQTSRTVGAAPTAQTIASANTSFTAVEVIDRVNAGESEIALHGGLESWLGVGSRIVKRNVSNFIEAAQAAAVLGSSATEANILNDLIGTAETAAETVADYAEGTIALVGSKRVINRVKKYAEVTDRMIYTGIAPGANVRDVRNISDDQLAATLGVDTVLPGPLAAWYTASANYQERLAIIVLPDPNASPLEGVQYGRTVRYQVSPGNANTFELLHHYDDNLIADVLTCRSWFVVAELNSEALYILNGCDALNASSTTTTTTT